MTHQQQESLFLQKIPREVIAHALWLCIPDFDDYTPNTPKKDPLKVLELGTICHSIRQLVYSMPALWATVTFRPQPSDDFAYISEWLKRAGSTQLSLRVDINSVKQGRTFPWFRGQNDTEAEFAKKRASLSILLSTIRPYLPSCVSLDLRLPYITRQLAFEGPSKEPLLHRVKTLNLEIGDERARRRRNPVVGPGNGLDVAPNLQEVRLTGLPIKVARFPWHNIVELELTEGYISECALVVSQTPSLRYLAMVDLKNRSINDDFESDWGSDEGDEVPTSQVGRPAGRIVLSHLVSLDWQSIVHPRISRFFDKLCTPCLTHFRYYPYMPCIGYPLDIFEPFLCQAAPSLSVIVAKNIDQEDLEYFRSVATKATAVLVDGNGRMFPRVRPPRLDEGILSLYDGPGSREWRKVECILPARDGGAIVED